MKFESDNQSMQNQLRVLTILLLLSAILILQGTVVSAQQTEVADMPELDPDFAEALENGEVRLTLYRTDDELDCRLNSSEQFVSIPNEGIFDLTSGRFMENIPSSDFYSFSRGGNYVNVDGVYDLRSGERVEDFPIADSYLFSENDSYVALTYFSSESTAGIYNVNTRERIVGIPATSVFFGYSFSNDETYVSVVDDGVYRLDGEQSTRIDEIPPNAPGANRLNAYDFDPTSTYVGVFGIGVFRLSDGTFLEAIPANTSTSTESLAEYTFSNNGEYVAIDNEGVYRLEDGTHLDNIPYDLNYSYFFGDNYVNIWFFEDTNLSPGAYLLEGNGVDVDKIPFNSPDGEYVAYRDEGVFRTSNNEIVDELPIAGDYIFSPSGETIAIFDTGVYRMDTFEKINSIPVSSGYVFSPDGNFLAIEGDGVYSLADGTKVLDDLLDGNIRFGFGERSIFVELRSEVTDEQRADGIFPETIGCAVYTATANYPNVGTINVPGGVNVRQTPEILSDNIADTTSSTTSVALHGASEDGEWYLITYNDNQVWISSTVLPNTAVSQNLPTVAD